MGDKKTKKYIPVLVLLICLAVFANAQNVLSNGDFENGFIDWNKVFPGIVTMDNAPDEGRYVSDAVTIIHPADNSSYWYQNVMLTPGVKYLLHGYIRGINVADGEGACLEYAGSGVSARTSGLKQINGWQYISTAFTADAGGEVRLRLGYPGGNSWGQVYFDDIRLEPMKLQIIVAKALYNPDLQAAIATYQSDIAARGWSSIVKTVSDTSANNPDWVCPSAEQLKAYINTEYYNGWQGGDIVSRITSGNPHRFLA